MVWECIARNLPFQTIGSVKKLNLFFKNGLYVIENKNSLAQHIHRALSREMLKRKSFPASSRNPAPTQLISISYRAKNLRKRKNMLPNLNILSTLY